MMYFTLTRFIGMVQFVDASVSSEVIPDYFNELDRYTSDKDTFAFGIAGWQDDSPLDLDYGSLKLQYEFWNATHDIFVDVKSRPCRYSDFGYDLDEANPNQKFYDPPLEKEVEFKTVIDSEVLMCIDEEIELYGDFNTANAKVLLLNFVKCDTTKRTTCKSEQEVKKWLTTQFLLFSFNKITFMHDGYRERMFQKITSLEWIPIDILQPVVAPYRVQITETLTNDNYFPSYDNS